VLPQLRRFEHEGAQSEKELGPPKAIDATAGIVATPELTLAAGNEEAAACAEESVVWLRSGTSTRSTESTRGRRR
jgi:hypothetical protein